MTDEDPTIGVVKPAPTTQLPAGNGGSPQVPALRTDGPGPAPKRRTWLWLGVGGVAFVLAGLAYLQPWVAKPPVVVLELVTPAPVTRVLAVNGRIAAARSVDVRPLVSGAIQRLDVAEGDLVTGAQVLATINADAASAQLRQAVAGLDAALVSQTGARDTYDRSAALGGTVARTTLEQQARALQSATQEVTRLTAMVDQAQIALDNHTIRAPISGTVLNLPVDPGQTVDPSTVLMTLADLTDLLVETDVDEVYATQVARGQSAVLQLAGQAGTHPGQVSYVSDRVDVSTGGLAVKLGFDTPVTAPVGLTVTANIVVDQQNAALTVPRTAIAVQAGVSGVFVAEEGSARFRPVQSIDWPAARLIVTEGLSAGDALIVDATGLVDGQAITVQP